MDYNQLPKHIKDRIKEFKTPFFLFDLDRIGMKLDILRKALEPDDVYYAVKCNSLPPVLATLAGKGCGFEANNMAEMEKVLAAKVHPERVINSSPITPAADVRAMYALGVKHFAIDSRSQIDNLKHNAPGCSTYLRLYSTNEGSRFDLSKRLGVHMEDAPALLVYARKSGLHVNGLTFHVGSQCSSPNNWRAGLRDCAALFRQFSELKVVNIGGGYPISYNGAVPGIEEIARAIRDECRDSFRILPTLQAEPGRFLVGDCAMTGTSVILVEDQKPLSRAVVDLSVFCGFIEIIENGGGMRYPVMTDARGKTTGYRIGGATCAGTDILAEEAVLPRLKVDHLHPYKSSRIYFAQTGAYTLDYIDTGRKAGFNGAPIPVVYYLKNGRLHDSDAATQTETKSGEPS